LLSFFSARSEFGPRTKSLPPGLYTIPLYNISVVDIKSCSPILMLGRASSVCVDESGERHNCVKAKNQFDMKEKDYAESHILTEKDFYLRYVVASSTILINIMESFFT
jgi:hypothetical protein